MPVFKKEIVEGPEVQEDVVRCRVTAQGHGKISTGKHDPKDGEEFYAENEIVELPLSTAKLLSAGDPPHNHAGSSRYYVEIMKPAKAAQNA